MTWDEEAVACDENGAVRAYASAAHESLERLRERELFEIDGARILDFGCGTGLFDRAPGDTGRACGGARQLARDGRGTVGEVGLTRALQRRRHRELARVRAGSGLDVFSTSFDVIVCSSVRAFLDDYRVTAARFVALLRPGGSFVQWDWELNPEDTESFGLTRHEVANTFTSAGLLNVWVGTGFDAVAGGQVMKPLMGVGQASPDRLQQAVL